MNPEPIATAPRNETDILLYSQIHGWITGHFSPGYWTDHPESGREYSGAVWVLGDDIAQVEVEEYPEGGFHDGEITHWMEALPKPKDIFP